MVRVCVRFMCLRVLRDALGDVIGVVFVVDVTCVGVLILCLLDVFLACVGAFCVRFVVCCSMAWFCFVLVRLNILLIRMCVSFAMYCVIVFCFVWCVCLCVLVWL